MPVPSFARLGLASLRWCPEESTHESADYTATALTLARHVKFKYKLEDWVDAGPRRQAFYTNLGPGR